MKTPHLTEDQIIKYAVDTNDLDSEALAHLNGCGECRAKAGRFSEGLNGLARTAADLSFPPAPDIASILDAKSVFKGFQLKSKRPLAVLGSAVCILMMVLMSHLFLKPTQDTGPNPMHLAMIAAEMAHMNDDNPDDRLGLAVFRPHNEWEEAETARKLFLNSLICFDDELMGQDDFPSLL